MKKNYTQETLKNTFVKTINKICKDKSEIAKPANFRRAFATFLTTYITSFTVESMEEDNSLLKHQQNIKSNWKLSLTTENGTLLNLSGNWNNKTGSAIRINDNELIKSDNPRNMTLYDTGIRVLQTAL